MFKELTCSLYRRRSCNYDSDNIRPTSGRSVRLAVEWDCSEAGYCLRTARCRTASWRTDDNLNGGSLGVRCRSGIAYAEICVSLVDCRSGNFERLSCCCIRHFVRTLSVRRAHVPRDSVVNRGRMPYGFASVWLRIMGNQRTWLRARQSYC
jgi:hypothetical protein